MSRLDLPRVSSRYGAPMGRQSEPLRSFAGLKVSLRRVPLDGGGYDSGGAYWGSLSYRESSRPLLYRAAADDPEDGLPIEAFFRARDRDDAKQQLVAACEGDLAPRFYR